MKKIFIVIIFGSIIGNLFYFYKIGFSGCDVTILSKTIDGNSMAPLLPHGDTIDLMIDYYNVCDKQIQKDDIVAYNYGGNSKALIKRVKVMDTDNVYMSGGYLIVNDEIFTNSLGDSYIFTPNEQNMLQLYIQNGKIPKESFLIFGDNISNSIDSRKFGAISAQDILGKFDF